MENVGSSPVKHSKAFAHITTIWPSPTRSPATFSWKTSARHQSSTLKHLLTSQLSNRHQLDPLSVGWRLVSSQALPSAFFSRLQPLYFNNSAAFGLFASWVFDAAFFRLAKFKGLLFPFTNHSRIRALYSSFAGSGRIVNRYLKKPLLHITCRKITSSGHRRVLVLSR